MSKPDQNIDHSRQGIFTQPRPFNGVEIDSLRQDAISTSKSMKKLIDERGARQVDPNLINGVEVLDSTMIVIADDHVQYITELTCERDQLLARIAELESTVLKLQGFVDAHYNRIRES